ncbi:nitroreductase family protein [Sporolactobacillus sp. Y61]|uniref:Nitroreductase family protein n=1 Tax=Sporolactobacillus sp. Y61 TaxID=3160863 RepID=A0AAU8IHI7_9BACL
MKKIMKRILPNVIINILKKIRSKMTFTSITLIKNYIYDFRRYRKYSGTLNILNDQKKNDAYIIYIYHAIEKGMSLPEPRIGFGKDKVKLLINLIERTLAIFGPNETTEVAVNTLFTYYHFNLEHGLDNPELLKKLNEFKHSYHHHFTDDGGTLITGREEINKKAKLDTFGSFLESRYSIRNFAKGTIDIDLIKKAVKMARKTPSVCNRQGSRVHVYSDNQTKQAVLNCQNGNRGFGNTADKVLLITEDLSIFHGVIERNQAYIDGGLFSMTLVYALHSLGIGTCCLNCSIDKEMDINLRRVTGIDATETPIMMIVIGWIPESLKVTQSHRKPVEEILFIH